MDSRSALLARATALRQKWPRNEAIDTMCTTVEKLANWDAMPTRCEWTSGAEMAWLFADSILKSLEDL